MECPVHAVLLPYPAQGHINPMMQLAKRLLSDGSFHVTFVNTEFTHEKMVQNGAGGEEMGSAAGRLRFVQVPDGLPAGHGRLHESVEEFMSTFDSVMPAVFRRAVLEIVATASVPVTCIVSDSMCPWVQETADELHVPRAALWTTPVHASLLYCAHEALQAQGVIPLEGKHTDKASSAAYSVPGVISLRAEDLLSAFQTRGFMYDWVAATFDERVVRRAAWNLGNNVLELESPAIEVFRAHVQRFVPVGPLLPLPFLRGLDAAAASGTSLFPESTRRCSDWLDRQAPGSVVYVSFGSIVGMSGKQLEEVALGLEESGAPFLWVHRALASESNEVFHAFAARIGERGLLVSWAPQLLVLSHPSVAGFLTHCGWNSISEGMAAGVPFLAWAGGFAEQNANQRYIADVWNIGLDFQMQQFAHDGNIQQLVTKDELASKIRCLMSSPRGLQLKKSAQEVATIVKTAISEEGSSHRNLNEFIKAMKLLANDSDKHL